jgi:hypothetical protein
MSKGRQRLRRIILQSINSTKYGCTVRQLVYASYGAGGEDGPTQAQVAAVEREVRLLLEADLVVERAVFGAERYLLPAWPAALTSESTAMQCLECDLRWVSEEGAPHLLCWSCGEPGQVVDAPNRRLITLQRRGGSGLRWRSGGRPALPSGPR